MKKPFIDRERALAAKPQQAPYVKRTEKEQGLSVTVKLKPKTWMKWLGSGELVERTFELDALGREVYYACDGSASVKQIIRDFAKKHKIAEAESEMAVTTYMKTLMTKNLIYVAVDRKKE